MLNLSVIIINNIAMEIYQPHLILGSVPLVLSYFFKHQHQHQFQYQLHQYQHQGQHHPHLILGSVPLVRSVRVTALESAHLSQKVICG